MHNLWDQTGLQATAARVRMHRRQRVGVARDSARSSIAECNSDHATTQAVVDERDHRVVVGSQKSALPGLVTVDEFQFVEDPRCRPPTPAMTDLATNLPSDTHGSLVQPARFSFTHKRGRDSRKHDALTNEHSNTDGAQPPP